MNNCSNPNKMKKDFSIYLKLYKKNCFSSKISTCIALWNILQNLVYNI